MPADLDILRGRMAPSPGRHEEAVRGTLYREHRLGSVRVKVAVKLADEFGVGRIGQLARFGGVVDGFLHMIMGSRFDEEVALVLVAGAGQGAFNIARTCVVRSEEHTSELQSLM